MSRTRRGVARTPTSSGRVELHIDRLVLDGVSLPAGEVGRLQSALERELGRLLTGVPHTSWSSAALAKVPMPSVALSSGASGTVWGRHIAHSLFVGLSAQVVAQPKEARGPVAPPTPLRRGDR